MKLGYRAKTLKEQARQFVQGRIIDNDLRQIQDSKKLADALDNIYGVGPQSAWYMSSEFFHIYDSLDYVSSWEGRIVARVLFSRQASLGKSESS